MHGVIYENNPTNKQSGSVEPQEVELNLQKDLYHQNHQKDQYRIGALEEHHHDFQTDLHRGPNTEVDFQNEFIVDMTESDQVSNNGRNFKGVPDPNMQFAKTIVVLNQEEVKEPTVIKSEHQTNINIRQNPSFIHQVSTNRIVLFFFINPIAGTGSGQNVMNMNVTKVEFSDKLKCPGNQRCTAYIYNLNDPQESGNGIEVLREELSRGKIT